MNPTTKHACSLNNQGVDLLVSGESTRAMQVLQSALSLLEMSDQEAETKSSTEMNISCDDASLPFYESISTVTDLQGMHCYVYDHGFMISDNINGKNTDEVLSLFIAIVLFNSALASHSEGTALGRDESLTRASVLYNLAVQHLTRCTIPEVNTFTTILTLLALNNEAQIHYDQYEHIQAVDCMKDILNIGSVSGLHSVLNRKDLNGILLNVMVFSTPKAAQAA